MKRLLLFLLILFAGKGYYAQCGAGTPTFAVNLSSAPNATWVSTAVVRNDTCCGWSGSDVCIKFVITLHPNSMGINFGIASGAMPTGALYYSINCGPPVSVGTPICLSGTGPHVLTFCKPGNNQNTYSISAIPAPVVPDSILVRNGCTQTLSVSGYSVPTITWNSVNPGSPGAYNSYLSCTAGCATVQVTPTGTPPPFVDYVVGGFGQSPCQAAYFQDTVRVYFYSNLLATINPTLTTICFGSTNAVLTGSASGGLPPYTYSWSPVVSSGTQVTVGPGTYTLKVFDNTGCPPTTATAVVNQFTLPISANAGPDKIICKASPTVALTGTVTNATGGAWSGGSGTFAPTANSVTTNYIPTATELNTGVQLYLTTTGNSGCPPKQDTVFVSFQNVPIANAGPDHTVCANNSSIPLNGVISGFSSTGTWSTNGSGVFTSTTNLNTTYLAGSTTGTFNIILTSTGNGVCPAAKDTAKVIVTPSPTVNAGPNYTICSTGSAQLNGIVTGPTNTGIWSSSGTGTFSPFNTLNASYFPSAADIATGTVTLVLTSTGNGNCLAVTDTLKITINQLAIVNAGSSQTLCSIANTVALNGTVSGGSSIGNWTSSGSGLYNPSASSLNTIYNLTNADKATGTVNFTLTSTNNGACPPVTSTLNVFIVPIATVNAGAPQTICSNSPSVTLNGTINGPASPVWSSSGTGIYSPLNTVVSPDFAFSQNDINNGVVIFTLTAINNAPCPAVTATTQVTIIKIATVTTSPTQTICSTTNSIALTGSVTGGVSNGVWTSSGTGAFSPGAGFLNTNYFTSANDINAAFVTFTLTSGANSPCPVVTNTTAVYIIQLATVNAGNNQVICSNNPSVTLAGTITGAASPVWSTNGTGMFSPLNTVISPDFAFSQADINSGVVVFTLTAANNAPCPAVTATTQVTIIKMATVTAGPTQSLCSTASTLALNGLISGGVSNGVWSTSGTGAFNPGAGFLNTTYFISVNDVNTGSVTYTLTSAANAPCPVVTSTTALNLFKIASVNAGPNSVICSNSGTVSLSGSLSGAATTASWSTGTNGAFLPANTSFSPAYVLTTNDIVTGFADFTLTSVDNGPCPAVSDSVRIKIIRTATVNAGPDKAICTTQLSANFTGTVNGASGTGIWSAIGSGNFTPANTALNVNYNPSVGDVATGNVFIVLSSTGNAPCPVVRDTARLTIITNPVITILSDTTVCEKQNPVTIGANVTGGSGSILWTSSGSGAFSTNWMNPVKYTFSQADINNGSVILSITSNNNGPCGNVSGNIKVNIKPSPVADFAPSTYTAYIPNDPVKFTNLSSGANSYSWDFGNGSTSNAFEPIHNYPLVGFYNVQLIATNQFNCTDTAIKMIKVISDIQFPTAFTPNTIGSAGGSYDVNNYSNDVFFPYTAGVTEYNLMIFNRWGELIFESNDIAVGWDGYFNGKPCQQDAYVWKANVKFFDGRIYKKVGSVTIVR